MSIKVSHSSKDKFISCPRKWFLHYKRKLRSPKVGSALFFGNALDDAFSRMLLDKKPDKTESELAQLDLTPEEIFAAKMLEAKNDAGQLVEIPKSPLADYYTSDFNAELFTTEIVELVSKMEQSLNTLPKIIKFHEHCKKTFKDKKKLSNNEFILYNYINWLSLSEKGKLMLQAYKEQIFPEIHTVHSIQKEIEIINDLGDRITGKIDLIASFTDKPDVPYICDNKSSSKAYSDDSVIESEQLATYAEAENNTNGAYLVIQKTIFKKVPVIRTQIIKDIVAERTLKKTFDNFEDMCNNIAKAGDEIDNYPQNFNSCFAFGKICPFYQLCKHNSNGNLVDCSKGKDEKNS